ncbi:hypothetical protein C2R22_03745 [Salinigranum rubrum]|uniref:Uncharacterized protein n=1 Tax=Salinigranum rubrum TaxID=755307 RepID=A0A2I8VG37_9EURY|nr:galactose oxidase-like domain-containing protein [Salinigranum rubrum]AUV80881.1 hypothetical protein C2R22_03745 [Salinigranum rubrum]
MTGEAETPEEGGAWEPVEHRFDHLPVHVALLHTGKVLAFGGSGNDETRLHHPYPAELFDPETGSLTVVDQELGGDVFCVGHAFLPDGRLLAAGGTYRYDGGIDPPALPGVPDLPNLPPFAGLDHTYLFDPDAERWTRGQDVHAGRWYPTLVTMGDGSVLAAAGLTKHPPWVALRKLELYTPGEGWRVLRGAGRWLPLYPRLHLLPDGTVFYAGSYNTHYTFPFSLRAFPTARFDVGRRTWTEYGLPSEQEREEGASALLPLRPGDDYRARVLLAGGGTPTGTEAVADTELIDLSAPDPRWRSVDSMAHARYYAYAVLLPDGTVFVMGGRSGKKGHVHGVGYDPETGEVASAPNAVHEAERFDPATETWTALAPMTVDRLYHSNALLLPDGRVLTCGSNPRRRVDELRIELYRPPYLFAGPRPTVDAAPERVVYGEAFDVETPDAPEVDEVVLVRQSSTTHCLNTDQRLVELVVEAKSEGTLTVRLPANPSLLPPGYYLLFVLREGVPSVAPFVRVAGGD